MISVLVTGKDSQLALCLKDLEESYPLIDFTFRNSTELDITSKTSIANNFKTKNFDYCINCAAYTAVDKAELEPEKAKLVNTIGAKNLALACKKHNVVLIHISTDFVFDGKKKTPYTEGDQTNPVNVYGKTKRDGETEIDRVLDKYFIIRTSWLYSKYGSNFVKTILRLAEEKDEINVVDDQIGSPTYALDLAEALIHIIYTKSNNYGVYHYSNRGEISWFTFAKTIISFFNCSVKLTGIPAKSYKTKAQRPQYSVLSTKKITSTFGINPVLWEDALLSLKTEFPHLEKR